MNTLKTFALAALGLVTISSCREGRVNDDTRKLCASSAMLDSLNGKAYLRLVTETRKDSTRRDTVFYELMAHHHNHDSGTYRLAYRDGIGKTSVVIASKDTLRMIEYKDKETARAFTEQVQNIGETLHKSTGDTITTREQVLWNVMTVRPAENRF